MKAMYRLDGIITVVDAARVETHLDEEKFEGAQNESVDRLTFVDRIILNKYDLLPSGNLKRRGCCSFCGGRRSILASVERHCEHFGPIFPRNCVVAYDPRCKMESEGSSLLFLGGGGKSCSGWLWDRFGCMAVGFAIVRSCRLA